jgi:16S rRNA processing protein RimM
VSSPLDIAKVVVGKLVGVHGLKGELKLLADLPRSALQDFVEVTASEWKELFVDGKPYILKRLRVHKGTVLVVLGNVESIEAAELLIGSAVFVEKDLIPNLSEGEHYGFELVGMEVVTDLGLSLGILEDIIETGSNDVYEVRSRNTKGKLLREVLLPAIDEVILNVDTEKRIMTVHLLEGLLDEEGDNSTNIV